MTSYRIINTLDFEQEIPIIRNSNNTIMNDVLESLLSKIQSLQQQVDDEGKEDDLDCLNYTSYNCENENPDDEDSPITIKTINFGVERDTTYWIFFELSGFQKPEDTDTLDPDNPDEYNPIDYSGNYFIDVKLDGEVKFTETITIEDATQLEVNLFEGFIDCCPASSGQIISFCLTSDNGVDLSEIDFNILIESQ